MEFYLKEGNSFKKLKKKIKINLIYHLKIIVLNLFKGVWAEYFLKSQYYDFPTSNFDFG